MLKLLAVSFTGLQRTLIEMALLAGLRAAIAMLGLIGRELRLTGAERRALVERIAAALLDPPRRAAG